MESLELVQALIMGLVEGLTEYLPVSSTGHLIIAGKLLGLEGEGANTFEIFIQLGAILGVVWLYRRKLWSVLSDLGEPSARRFVLNLGIAFLPAALLGFLLHAPIEAYLFNPVTVALALIAGGFVILLIERRSRPARVTGVDDLRALDALKVGMAQSLSLFPGVSRAGATIMGGLVAGLSRSTATEFSFFLAMPTMFAATLFELYKNHSLLRAEDTAMLAVGFAAAFVTAMVVVKALLTYVCRHDFTPFGYYRIAFGLLVLFYFR
jgi:undecaprenyl-diphosphatase